MPYCNCKKDKILRPTFRVFFISWSMNRKNLTETKERYLKTDYIEMWIEDGIYYGRYAEGVIIDKKIALDLFEAREAFCEHKPYLTFWDCRGLKYWTKEARDFQSTALNYRLMKAGAVLYKESHVANVIINFFMRMYPPPIPTKFFANEKKAIVWLKSLGL